MQTLRLILALTLALWLGTTAQALDLPRIFTDNMVLQRDMPVPIWGWADPGQRVKVTFAGQTRTVSTPKGGKWSVTLDPLPANADPAELTVSAGDQTVTVKNVLVGEVWICSGQSNMEWILGNTDNAEEAIAAAKYPAIRQFKVPHVVSTTPQSDLPGDWAVCSPETARNFTGVGYHFGRELHEALNVPIGLINTSWGGTRIEPWTDPLGFEVSPALENISRLIAGANDQHRKNLLAKLDQFQSWIEQKRKALEEGATDIGAIPTDLPQHPLHNAGRPTAIYNAMVAPLVPYAIRGAIWYQGESNNGEGLLYYEKMRALISSWRRLWNQGDFPFLYVQLAPYRYNRPDRPDRPDRLPGIWDAQLTALSIPNTGMAVITDIGNVDDIHPRNKREVGRRLSLWALAQTYGKDGLVYSGPLYKSMAVNGNQAVISFQHGQGLKSTDGKPLSWFSIAGPDRKFVEAKAEIVDDTVVVSAEGVDQPEAVRFGWHELAEPNLANAAGLPASPFRTDRW